MPLNHTGQSCLCKEEKKKLVQLNFFFFPRSRGHVSWEQAGTMVNVLNCKLETHRASPVFCHSNTKWRPGMWPGVVEPFSGRHSAGSQARWFASCPRSLISSAGQWQIPSSKSFQLWPPLLWGNDFKGGDLKWGLNERNQRKGKEARAEIAANCLAEQLASSCLRTTEISWTEEFLPCLWSLVPYEEEAVCPSFLPNRLEPHLVTAGFQLWARGAWE